mmetsp:Transcript_52665/g.114323  ORF Transcript_52665/g.114323 Transcript_52665/m.114323 type:complete len:145 (+) Transcript_52665:256-690(+)
MAGGLSLPRPKMSAIIVKHGGQVSSGVTRKVTHVITSLRHSEAASTAIEKADDLGTPLVSEKFLWDSLRAAEVQRVRPYLLGDPGSDMEDDGPSMLMTAPSYGGGGSRWVGGAGGSDDEDRPMCRYGAACYRKNPEHLRDFQHP